VLIVAQREAEVEGWSLKRGGGRVLIDLQQLDEPFGRRPVHESTAVIAGAARITKPDAALGLDLFEIGTAVSGEHGRHTIVAHGPPTNSPASGGLTPVEYRSA
jgi:hypothetical protein